MKTASVIPWVELASAASPDGTPISLWQRGTDLVIRAGAITLMSNRLHGSEELLATHGCERLGRGASILIGGLGMGFTLRAVLARVARDAEVLVSEVCAPVVEWVRGPIGAGDLLDDRRVAVDLRPAWVVIATSPRRFDAILLDVDNGPVALALGDNRRLYDAAGIATIATALKPGGRLAVWSAGDDDGFVARLSRGGLEARAVQVRAREDARARGRGARHTIFIGEKAGPDPRSPAAVARPPRDPRSRTRDRR